MKKKKLYINGRFMTQTITGVQRYAIEVVKSMDALLEKGVIDPAKYEFIVLVPSNTTMNLSFNQIQIKNVGLLKGQLWEQIELPFFSLGGLLINLCNTAPIIKSYQTLTIHDAAASANKQNYSLAFRLWYQILHRILPFRTEKIITDSQFSKSELMKYYPIKEADIIVIYLGIDHMNRIEEDDTILKAYDLKEKQYVLAVSSLNPNKNFKGIVQAIKHFENRDISVVIVGDKENPIFNEIGSLESSNVYSVGYIADEELKSLYKHAAGFIYPSFYEGFGLPPLEAMSCGCPVIASNVASLPEVLGDAALYCNPNDPEDITSKIELLLSDNKLKESLVNTGFKKTLQYNWQTCAKDLYKVIEEVIKK